MSRIHCRSRESTDCYNGRDEGEVYDPDGPGQSEDGTWDGESVLCDPCYIAIGQPVIGTEVFRTGKPNAAQIG